MADSLRSEAARKRRFPGRPEAENTPCMEAKASWRVQRFTPCRRGSAARRPFRTRDLHVASEGELTPPPGPLAGAAGQGAPPYAGAARLPDFISAIRCSAWRQA